MNEEKCHPGHLVCLQGRYFYYRRAFQSKEFKQHILEYQWINIYACYKRPQTVDIKETQRLTNRLEARMFQRSSISSLYFSIQPLRRVLNGAAYSTAILLIVSIPTVRCSFLWVRHKNTSSLLLALWLHISTADLYVFLRLPTDVTATLPSYTLVAPNFTVYPIKAIVEAMARFFMIHTIYAKDAKEGYSQQGMNSQFLKSSWAWRITKGGNFWLPHNEFSLMTFYV